MLTPLKEEKKGLWLCNQCTLLRNVTMTMAVIHLPQFFDHKNVTISIPITFFGATVGKDQYIVYFRPSSFRNVTKMGTVILNWWTCLIALSSPAFPSQFFSTFVYLFLSFVCCFLKLAQNLKDKEMRLIEKEVKRRGKIEEERNNWIVKKQKSFALINMYDLHTKNQ